MNEVINGQIRDDMRNFLRSGFGSAWNPVNMREGDETGGAAMAAAGLAEWTKTSGWARDTGGDIDPATGAPVRAQVYLHHNHPIIDIGHLVLIVQEV